MTLTLAVSIMGIAAVDSLNPSLFIAQFYLLTTPRPVPRLLSFIAGILVVNFGGGVLILAGVRSLVADVFSSMNGNTLHGLQLALGIALLGFGLWYKIQPKSNSEGSIEAKKPRSLLPIHTFVLGMVVMLDEITTALPYFVAIERITEADLSSLNNLVLLALYNIIFSLPLLGFIGLFVMYRQRFASQLARISQFVQIWAPRLTKYFSVLFGGVFMINAVAYFVRNLEFLK